MKTIFKLFLSFFVVGILVPSVSYSQVDFNDPKFAKYGADAESRERNHKNYMFFREAHSMGSYGDAIKRLEELVVACPEATENLYLIGVRIFREQMESADTDAVRMENLKNILRMYDYRIKYFGDKNNGTAKYALMGDKVKDMIRHEFMWNEHKDLIYSTVKNTIAESGVNVDLTFILVYFNELTNRFMSDMHTPEEVLTQFELLSEAVAKTNDSNTQKTLDALLLRSGAADCESLEALFKPQYEKNPNNIELVKKIMRYLSVNECESEFKLQLSEKYYKLDPSPEAAYALGTTFATKKEEAKAMQYFMEAINRETNKEKRSNYELRVARTYLLSNKVELAAQYAKRAIASDPRNGTAYFILGQAYSIGSNNVTCDSFDKKAIFWLIVENYELAKKNLDSSSPQISVINEQINVCKAHFPTMEDIFFKETIKVGDPFTVNCGWIKGVTKAYAPK